MKCASCGAEIKLGCMYCSNCGKEAQIVSESSLLEEELLRALLQEDEPVKETSGKSPKGVRKQAGKRSGAEATEKNASRQNTGKLNSGQNTGRIRGQGTGKRSRSTGRIHSGQETGHAAVKRRSGQEARDHTGAAAGQKRSGQKRSHLPLILTLVFLCLLLAGITAAYIVISSKNKNSYSYQLQKAQDCQNERNYTKALAYYKQALSLKQDDLEVRFQMVDLYQKMEEPSSAISMLHEIISIDPGQQEAYERLIALYLEKEDYEAILKLKDSVTDASIQELFSEFEANPPEFNLKPGTYEDAISIELSAEKGCEIYFTTNGEDPKEKGELYRSPISLEEQGTLEVKAVACNEYGVYSRLLQGKFVVKYKKPRMPKASPDGGTFYGPAEIELRSIEGGRMFYTWDGSTPTVDSEEYAGPIPVPEGNNILSVILVDEHGMVSDVLKCNYKYLP